MKNKSGLSIIGFILGLLGMLLSIVLIGVPLCVAGLVISIYILDLKKGRKGLAIAGLSMSAVGIIIAAIVFVTAMNTPVENDNNTDVVAERTMKEPETTTEKRKRTDQIEYRDLAIKYIKHEIVYNTVNEKVLVVYYEFTNNSDENKSFDYSFDDKCFQNGVEVERSWWHANEESKNSEKEIKKGTTLMVASSFVIGDSLDDVQIEIYPNWSDNLLWTLELKLE